MTLIEATYVLTMAALLMICRLSWSVRTLHGRLDELERQASEEWR